MLQSIQRLIAVLLGLPLVLAGTALLSWVTLTYITIEGGLSAAELAAQHTPFHRHPEELAKLLIQPGNQLAALVLGGILFVIGLLFFRAASRPHYPPDVSSDGRGRIVLAGPHSVGTPLEGRIQLLQRAKPGDEFVLMLHCGRWDRGRDDWQTFHEETRVVGAVGDGNAGLCLPFHFEVPATAPPSSRGFRPYEWKLGVRRRRWYSWRSSDFHLDMDPAPDWQIEAIEAEQPPELTAEVDDISRKLGWFTGRALQPHERHRLRQLPPIGREQLRIAAVIVAILVSLGVVMPLLMLVAQRLGVSS